MGRYKEITGDLIKLFKEKEFHVIAHGCNTMNIMGAGIAKQIKEEFPDAFYADKHWVMDYGISRLGNGLMVPVNNNQAVANCYTQVEPGPNADIDAIRFSLRKLNYLLKPLKDLELGLPLIGCGIGGLDWKDVRSIIQEELKDVNVTVVHYDKN